MNFEAELRKMRTNYKLNRQKIRLPSPPEWLTSRDRLHYIYDNSQYIISFGEVYYAALVQANDLLFKNIFMFDLTSDSNSPANFIYSTNEYINTEPGILVDLANQLFRYKNDRSAPIPEPFRETVLTIRDEHDRSAVPMVIPGFEDFPEPPVSNLIATFVFRPFLPKRKLISSLVPIIACDTYWNYPIILPQKYWSADFKKAWVKGEL